MNLNVLKLLKNKPQLFRLLINCSFYNNNVRFKSDVTYEQGQSPEKGIREYFYYIDHQGMLFLDDSRMKNFTSCFKDKEFLIFFFKRLQKNTTNRYNPEFPFISLCGRERNFIRCDDVPIVYTHIISNTSEDPKFCYNHMGDSIYNKFEPDRLYMSPTTGRVYHPCHEKGDFVGLVMSKLAIQISKFFTFDHGETKPPTKFYWNNKTYELDNQWYFKYRPYERGDL